MTFTIYSKEGCPWCDKIKQVMEMAGLTHVVYMLDVDYNRSEFVDEFGPDTTFPQIVMDDIRLGGCTDTIKYLKEQNIV